MAHSDSVASYSNPSLVLFVSIGGALLTALVFATSRLWLSPRLAAVIDLFPYDHWDAAGTALVKRPSQPGGACTVAFGLVAAAVIGVLTASFTGDNTISTQALVPTATVVDGFSATASMLSLDVAYRDGDAAACALRQSAVLQTTGIIASSRAMRASFTSEGCVISWSFDQVTLDPTATLSVMQPSWLSQHVSWALSSASAMSAMPVSVANGAVAASATARVNGTCSFTVSTTPTRLYDRDGVVVDAGIVLAALDSSLSMDEAALIESTDQVTILVALQVRGASRRAPVCARRGSRIAGGRACTLAHLVFLVQLRDVLLATTLSTRQSVPSFLSSVLGAVVAVLSIFRFSFKYAERLLSSSTCKWRCQRVPTSAAPAATRKATVPASFPTTWNLNPMRA